MPIPVIVQTIGLLVLPNVFMTEDLDRTRLHRQTLEVAQTK